MLTFNKTKSCKLRTVEFPINKHFLLTKLDRP